MMELPGNRRAVIIGIDKYEDKKINSLQGAESDAIDIYNRLSNPKIGHFKISEKEEFLLGNNATFDNIRKAISRLFWKTEGSDLALFYFSGHGFQDGSGNTYIAPFNMCKDEPFLHGINIEELKRLFHNPINRTNIIILDCCHGDVATAKGDGKSKNGMLKELFIEKCSGRYIIASTGDDETAREREFSHEINKDDKKKHYHGILSYYLIEGLDGGAADPAGIVTLNELSKYINGKLNTDKKAKQTLKYSVTKGEINNIPIAFSEVKATYTDRMNVVEEILASENVHLIRIFECCKILSEILNDYKNDNTALKFKQTVSNRLNLYKKNMTDWLLENQAKMGHVEYRISDKVPYLQLLIEEEMDFEKIPLLIETNKENILYTIYNAHIQKYGEGEKGIKIFVKSIIQYLEPNLSSKLIVEMKTVIKD